MYSSDESGVGLLSAAASQPVPVMKISTIAFGLGKEQ